MDEPVSDTAPRYDPALSGSTSQQARLPKGEREAARYAFHSRRLTQALSLSAFELQSFTPSPGLLLDVLHTSTVESLPNTTALLAQWRSKALPIPTPAFATQALVTRFTKIGSPATAIEVLADRKTYGLDLVDTPTPTIALLFASLRRNPTKTPLDALAVQATTALRLVEFAKPGDRPSIRVAQLSTLAILIEQSARDGEEKKLELQGRPKELLASLRKDGLDALVADGNAMAQRPRNRYTNAVEYVSAHLAAEEDAQFFKDVAAGVAK